MQKHVRHQAIINWIVMCVGLADLFVQEKQLKMKRKNALSFIAMPQLIALPQSMDFLGSGCT